MKIKTLLRATLLAIAATPVHAGGKADPLLGKFIIEHWEQRSDEQQSNLTVQGWLGYDHHKLWLKAERDGRAGGTEHGELQLLYRRAVAPHWDLHSGLRREFSEQELRDQFVIGIQGLAPFHLEVDASLYLDEQAQLNAELELSLEWRLSQQWVLEPEIKLALAAQGDDATGDDSGLRTWNSSLRLYYYPQRQWAPYIGLLWQRQDGGTADEPGQTRNRQQREQWLLGLRAWF